MGRTLGEIVSIVILMDFIMYWWHRLEHNKHVYKFAHKIHHLSAVTTLPLVPLSINFLEVCGYIVSIFLGMVIYYLAVGELSIWGYLELPMPFISKMHSSILILSFLVRDSKGSSR